MSGRLRNVVVHSRGLTDLGLQKNLGDNVIVDARVSIRTFHLVG